MERYREVIVREILLRLIPSCILTLIAAAGIIILIKYLKNVFGSDCVVHAKLIAISSIFFISLICGIIMFFDTRALFVDLNKNDFVEYYGEATFDSKHSSKDYTSFRLNDEKKTVVYSKRNVKATINKCNVYVVYGQNSKFVIVFEVKEIIEERPPINFP